MRWRQDLAIGIIVSLLVIYFIQPILNFLGKPFLVAISFICSRVVNLFFSTVAANVTASADLEMLSFIIGAFIASHLILWRETMLVGTDKKTFSSRILQKLDLKGRKHFLTFLIFLNILLVGSFLISITYNISLNRRFKQIASIIAPYQSAQEEKQLKANWVGMQSYEDFKKIDKSIGDYVKKYKIKVPKGFSYKAI